jgi:fructoselysine and glucoselysine-specific PTS system IIC component
MDVSSALIVGLVLMGAKFLDWWASTQLARPIFCVAILGALLGHPQEGIVLAAQLELVFIGNVSLGGVMPSDITMGSIFGGAFAMLLGQDIEVAMTLAIPLSALGSLLYSLMKIVVTSLVPKFEKLLEAHNWAGYERLWIIQFCCFELCYFVLGFVATLAGQPAVAAFVDAIPSWLNASLKVAAAALPALGLAMLLKSLYTKESFPYFFLGFGLIAFFTYTKVTGASIVDDAIKLTTATTSILSLVEVAVIGGVICAVTIYRELHRIEDKASAKQISAGPADESEDFFND